MVTSRHQPYALCIFLLKIFFRMVLAVEKSKSAVPVFYTPVKIHFPDRIVLDYGLIGKVEEMGLP